MTLSYILGQIFADSAINPVKILILFISMTVLSVFLDELGFFKVLANAALKKAGKSQRRLFFILYFLVSVLTVFTSNDIIVLTFTPFICYFAAAAHVKPVPFLVTLFVAANTWSMALIIGNPTNIYLATSAGVDFISYLKIMIFPTLGAGLVSLLLLYVIFRRDFSVPIEKRAAPAGHIKSPVLLFAGIFVLVVCTVMLAISSYVGLEMWIVALGAVIFLVIFNLIYAMIARRKPTELLRSLKRAPWNLVPFLLIMFVLVLFLEHWGVAAFISRILNGRGEVWKYGISSFLTCNVINNIPMSVLFSKVIEAGSAAVGNAASLANVAGSAVAGGGVSGLSGGMRGALFATIIGSNIGAFLTPFGALAGLMWMKILKKQEIKYSWGDFVKYGVAVGFPTICAALGILGMIV